MEGVNEGYNMKYMFDIEIAKLYGVNEAIFIQNLYWLLQKNKIDNVDFSKLHTFEEVTVAASNSETVRQLEDVLMIWYKQIEQVSWLE